MNAEPLDVQRTITRLRVKILSYLGRTEDETLIKNFCFSSNDLRFFTDLA